MLWNLSVADMDCLLCGRLWSEQWWVPCSFRDWVKSFLLCIVGEMAQDVGMMWMCCGVVSILFGWFLRVLSLLFCDLFLLCFFLFFLFFWNSEKRGGKRRRGEDAWSVKYESIKLCCSKRTKNHHKFKCFQVKFTTYGGFSSPSKAS